MQENHMVLDEKYNDYINETPVIINYLDKNSISNYLIQLRDVAIAIERHSDLDEINDLYTILGNLDDFEELINETQYEIKKILGENE